MYTIKLNSRELTNHVLQSYLGLDPVQTLSMSRLIDHLHRLDRADFIAQADAICHPTQRESGLVEKLLDVLAAERLSALPQTLHAHPAVAKLKQLMEQLEAAGVSNAVFDVTLMRGFDYYTDIVFEIFDTHPDNNRSVMGGGRYDALVGQFGVAAVPTVGFGLGDVTLANFLELHQLLPQQLPPETDVYVVLAGDVLQAAQKTIADLRRSELNVAVDLSERKLDKQIATADKKGIRYVVIIGESELADGRLTLKNLHSGKEEKHSLERIVGIIKDYRHPKNELTDV